MSFEKKDDVFREFLAHDLLLAGRESSEANIVFLIEELVVSHLLTEFEVDLPKILGTGAAWRLLCYPGDPPTSLVYAWRKGLLVNRSDLPRSQEVFSHCFYNMETRVLVDFNLVDLEATVAERRSNQLRDSSSLRAAN